MQHYKAPLDDIRFVLHHVLKMSQLRTLDAFKTADPDVPTVNSFLEMVAQLCQDVLLPLNEVGDREGCKHDADKKTVTTPKGFKEAYEQFCQSGLPAFACDPAYGGMGMPIVLNTAISEMLCSANLSFGMYPGLSHGAYNALHAYGTDTQKKLYLPKIVSGEWSGTMCLTEPHCGTDLGLMKTKAVKQADGTYKISGTKIFISAGEHDLTSNICHLVLAKIDDPETPKGIKGVSLFIVPKYKLTASGDVGERNDAFCSRIEEKMGIHGNSTCQMQFDDAVGELVGLPHKGMNAMFVMMNEARLGVGMQGLGLSEIAYQNALIYAQDRIQSQRLQDPKGATSVTIIEHPDVRRELLSIKANVEAGRMLSYWLSMQLDLSHHHPDEKVKKQAKKIADLLTPIIKAHFTDNAVDNTNSAIQVFGGHGYIKEHGVEQFNRDARITRLYEGTNGIQALDLIGRKVMDQNLLPAYLETLKADLKTARRHGVSSEFIAPVEKAANLLVAATGGMRRKLILAGVVKKLEEKTRLTFGPFSRKMAKLDTETKITMGAISVDYLRLMSLVSMGHMWVKMLDVAIPCLRQKSDNSEFYETKVKTARFYMEKIMPEMYKLQVSMQNGARSIMELQTTQFAHTQGTVAVEELPVQATAASSASAP